MSATASCFHCGLPVPTAAPPALTVLGAARDFCCTGCREVARTIVDAGLDNYYQDRPAPSGRPADTELPAELLLLDHPEVQKEFVFAEDDVQATELNLEGLSCAACGWLIESRLRRLPGVELATVNLSTHRLHLRWQPAQLKLTEALQQIAKLGYTARPWRADEQEEHLEQEANQLLRQLFVAGLGMMQVMMYALGLYVGPFQDLSDDYRDLLRYACFVLTTPVVFYSGQPFYRAAWRGLRARQPGMDLPVSIALISAYAASIYAMLAGTGETYFDSVTMFIFFLSTSRYLELRARQRATGTLARQRSLLPRLAHRLDADGSESLLPLRELKAGDHIRVRAGDTIPVDGTVVSGHSAVSEAVLTGEPLPLERGPGNAVVGGSINTSSPLVIAVKADAGRSLIATLDQLLNRALAERPQLAQRADELASFFVARILVVAAVVFAVWWAIDPSQAFWITLAVLVATCPCALSIATPVALTVATHRLAEQGFLITRGHVLETLGKVTEVVFDKTGTLTEGKLRRSAVVSLRGPDDQALALARALEAWSEHPIAQAFRDVPLTLSAENVHNHLGDGLSGEIYGRQYRLGKPAFAWPHAAMPTPTGDSLLWLLLANADGPLAWFGLDDQPRPDAATALAGLREAGLKLTLLSGDSQANASRIGQWLGLNTVLGDQRPEDKLAYVQRRQAEGAVLMMVGDGVNDAPGLGQAHLSVAMASGTDLTRTRADAVLLHDRLQALVRARAAALRTTAIIRQNLRWSLVYNFGILPAAAVGWVPPWLAAIGMSLSSLLVVLNALRLKRG